MLIFQIFIQLTVLVAAVMFIFLGIPLPFCLTAVPIVIVALYASVYSAFFSKGLELAHVSDESQFTDRTNGTQMIFMIHSYRSKIAGLPKRMNRRY